MIATPPSHNSSFDLRIEGFTVRECPDCKGCGYTVRYHYKDTTSIGDRFPTSILAGQTTFACHRCYGCGKITCEI